MGNEQSHDKTFCVYFVVVYGMACIENYKSIWKR